jgi:hypothetical protein
MAESHTAAELLVDEIDIGDGATPVQSSIGTTRNGRIGAADVRPNRWSS